MVEQVAKALALVEITGLSPGPSLALTQLWGLDLPLSGLPLSHLKTRRLG